MKAKTIMSTREAAQALGVGLRHILTLLYEGKLPGAYKLGLQWQIPKDAVDARIRARRSP